MNNRVFLREDDDKELRDLKSPPENLGRLKGHKLQLQGIMFAMERTREECKELDVLEKDIDALARRVDSLTLRDAEDVYEEIQRRKKLKNKRMTTKAICVELEDEPGPNRNSLSRAERLERLAKEVHSVCSILSDIGSLRERVEQAELAWKKASYEVMREAADGILCYPPVVMEGERPATRDDIIAAMNSDNNIEISLIDFERTPVKPKNCSRSNWLEHVKAVKRFANILHHTCIVMNTGNSRHIDVELIHKNMPSITDWLMKWEKNPLMEHIEELIDHEIIMRLKDLEYVFCCYCFAVSFNLKQVLSHFCEGAHNVRMDEIPEIERSNSCISLVSSQLQVMSNLPMEIHNDYYTVYTVPFIKSGMRMLGPSSTSIPTPAYVEMIKKKYESINGEIDSDRLHDPTYVASILKGIVSRHKSAVGRQLFAELDQYFKDGKYFHCKACGWLLTSRSRYYKHLKNPMHISVNMGEIGKSTFCLFTFSINIHTSKWN